MQLENVMSRDSALPQILLPPSLDLSASETLQHDLAAALDDGGIALDGTQVERVATPCLQVLAAAAITARDRRRPFQLCRPSDALKAAIADLGLGKIISFGD